MSSRSASTNVTYVAVVDDDESICRSFGRLLRVAGFQPVVYLSAEAFLEDAKRPRFDCLVLDIQLGGMSGVELRDRLLAVRDFTPVVFITAYDEPDVRDQALAAQCCGYFRKTDPAEVVIEAIRRGVAADQDQPTLPDRPAAPPRTKPSHEP